MLTINDVRSLSEGITVNGLTASEWSAKVHNALLKIYERYGNPDSDGGFYLDPTDPDQYEQLCRRDKEIEIFLSRPVSYLG